MEVLKKMMKESRKVESSKIDLRDSLGIMFEGMFSKDVLKGCSQVNVPKYVQR